ncbi:MAG: hypothetical protein HY537_06685 [Deltaproteobacteria bacterium]|nr:hypothetical protein [Deltaproteobacteria bacterium]
MKKSWMVFAFLMFLFLAVQSAYPADQAQEKIISELSVFEVASQKNSVVMKAALSQSPMAGITFSAHELPSQKNLRVSTSQLPVNLWILVDSSSVCHALKVDKGLSQLFSKLRNGMHPESLISAVFFTNTTLEIVSNHRPLKELEPIPVNCDKTLLASSYERALLHLLRNQPVSELPTVVWIFTSGNVELSAQTAEAVRKHKLRLHLVLYNKFIEKEIRPLVVHTSELLGKERIGFSTLVNPEAPRFPEAWYRLELSLPTSFNGSKYAFRITANDPSGELANQSLTANVVLEKGQVWFRWLVRMTIIITVLLSVGYLLYRLGARYRPKFCRACKRRLRHSDAGCPFCHGMESAYLVGQFNFRERLKVGKDELIPLAGGTVELGTHRKSVVPLLRPKGHKRACFGKVSAEMQLGTRAFKLVTTGRVPIFVNGNVVKDSRYLASGDRLSMGGVELIFFDPRRDVTYAKTN